jgi:uncharacterized protein
MKIVEVIKIIPTQQGVVLLLGQVHGEKVLVITIGEEEARAITRSLDGASHSRPLTHDLFKNLIEAWDCNLLKLEIHSEQEQIFFADLFLEQTTGEVLTLDCRPSDGIALALRFSAPIFIKDELLEEVGIPTEESALAEDLSEMRDLAQEEDSIGDTLMVKNPINVPEIDSANEPLDDLSLHLRELKFKLDQAVRAEKYEDAAKIRDEIKRIKGESLS